MSVLTVDGLTKGFGHHVVLREVGFRLARGDRAALIGPNGAGKTTLLEVVAGRLRPDAGRVHLASGLRLGYLPQEPELPEHLTVRQAALEAFRELDDLERQLREAERALAAPEVDPGALQAYGELQARFERAGGYAREHVAEATLAGLGLPPADHALPVSRLSGGQRVRLALARLLLQQPDLLLCDEPTNHLDVDAVAWLEQRLARWPGALLLVSHDRYLLDRVCTRTLELEDGRLTAYPGGYSAYVRQRRERAERAAEERARAEAEVRRLQAYVERYRAGHRARQAKSRGRRLERLQRSAAPEPPAPARAPQLRFAAAGATGREVLSVEGLAKSFGARVLFAPWDAVVERGERVGVVGPNGAGKTTLLRVLAGEEPPTGGGAYWGHGVRLGWLRQDQSGLHPEATVLDHVLEAGEALGAAEARHLLARLQFRGDAVFRRAADLSGGERSRLLLCTLCLARANVLLCDEPTNHLDIPAREALEVALADFRGTLFVVSHDRYLLERLCTRIWWVEGGRVRDVPGGWPAYAALRQAALPAPPDRGATRGEPAARAAAGPRPRPARMGRESRSSGAARLEEAIVAAEAEVRALGERLADPALYRDGAAAAGAVRAYEEAQRRLDDLYARWEAAVEATPTP